MSDTTFRELFREGTQLLHRGEASKALPLLEEAYDIAPDHADAALNLSGAYIMIKKFRKAVPILEVLVEREPENVMAWTNLGAAYLGNPVLAREEEQLQAIAAFEVAHKINPVAPNVAYNIGLIYRDRQDVDSAVHWFRKAVQANPADRDARNWLAKLQG